MRLLFDEDYAHLKDCGLAYVEDEPQRFLIFKDFPLPAGVYVGGGAPRDSVDVLYVVPPNYNTEGGDMFWVYPYLSRPDGRPIPAVNGPGQDSRMSGGIEYLRRSRHWNKKPWKPKVDTVSRIVDRLTWAFANPDAE